MARVKRQKHFNGHLLYWARGFPFEAFGLPNQYLRPAPSVAVFGFQYDEQFLGVMGEPWAGVREAEQTLLAQATTKGQTLEELRRGRQGLFDRRLAEQTKDREARPAATATGPP